MTWNSLGRVYLYAFAIGFGLSAGWGIWENLASATVALVNVLRRYGQARGVAI